MSRVQIGLEALVNECPEKIRGARIGVVCHPASVDAELRHALDLLAAAGGRIVAIFGPAIHESHPIGTATPILSASTGPAR